MEPSPEKMDLEDLIGDYIILNIPAFQTYLKQVWKDLLGRSDNKEKGVNKITTRNNFRKII